MSTPWFGVDLGGTKLLGVALDPDSCAVLATTRAETPTGGTGIVESIAGVAAALTSQVGAPAGVGIGAAGLVDQFGVLRFAPNLPGVVDLDLVQQLSDRLGKQVRVDNDATCAALAELRIGAARGAATALVVALGTGIGGALIMDGTLRRGAHHMAGEFGHLLVDPDGPLCGCGQRGCWEQHASGSALGRLGREAARSGIAPSLVAAVDGRIDEIAGEHVTAAAAEGRADAVAIMDRYGRWVAIGLAGLVNICDPEIIVVGGGLVESGDTLLGPVRAHLDELVVGSGHRPAVPVVAATAGDAAAAVGAALLVGEALD